MNTQTSTPQIDNRLELAKRLAIEAGKGTLEFFQSADLAVESKSDDSPVTVADKNAEQFIRSQLASHFPDDGIIGEEFGESAGTSGYRWIVDPIDGTKSFISGVPLYGTLIGVEHEGKSLIGVIYIPCLDECVYAAKGQGAWYVQGDKAPVRAQVSDCKTLKQGLFVTSQVSTFAARNASAAFGRLEESAYITRTWGDCYGYLLVATGRAAAMVDPMMSVWDAAALQPIMEEAGGTFTDWSGKPTIFSGEGIGTNGHVLEEVLAICQDYPALS
ncbi:MAG: histidinol-phosphatase [Blastopirellula sp.]|nr:MAG: histidinol-phosphatase [Blastopirellula sp.]